MQEYGTLEPVVVEKRSRSKYAVVVAGVLLCAAVAAFTFTTSARVNSAVDSNKDKSTYSPVTGAELVEETIADPSKRFAVFRFTPDRSQIVPTVTGEATMSWNGDWRAFTAAFPEDDVACGVYGFPYWVDEDNYDVKQILFTWAPASLDPRELARAGYFIGSVAINFAKQTEATVAIESLDQTYMATCQSIDEIEDAMCDLEGDAHGCPFNGESNPCDSPKCDGASFINGGAPGSVSQECCDEFSSFCELGINSGNRGCKVVVKSAWERLCSDYVEPEPVVKPTGMVTPTMVEICDEDMCNNACTFLEIDEEGSSYRNCAGCASDKACNSEAYGFVTKSCCGIIDECEAQSNEFMCSQIDGCIYDDHLACPGIQEELYRAASPSGCCFTEYGNQDTYVDGKKYDCDKDDTATFEELDCAATFAAAASTQDGRAGTAGTRAWQGVLHL